MELVHSCGYFVSFRIDSVLFLMLGYYQENNLALSSGLVGGRPARFQTSNFVGPYNLHRLLLSGLGLLFRSLPIVLLDQS